MDRSATKGHRVKAQLIVAASVTTPVPRIVRGTGVVCSASTGTGSRIVPDHIPALSQLIFADLAAGVPLRKGPLGGASGLLLR